MYEMNTISTCQVWSNFIGLVSSLSDVNAPEVYAELHGDSVSVYVDLNDSNNIRLLAIHTCRTYRYVGGLEICQVSIIIKAIKKNDGQIFFTE